MAMKEYRVKFVALFLVATCIKILLVPSYHSTDFDVHRNWMAITSNLPLKDWYHEHTSEWTLDYPPFFAYFEYVLSKFAYLANDPHMLDIRADPYDSPETVWYQRVTVMLSDVVLFFAIAYYSSTWPKSTVTIERPWSESKMLIVSCLSILSPGLFLVDHIHFQYNGFLLGILILSVACIRARNNLLAAALYTSLVMFKHLFVVMAPLYFVYMLRHYCFVGVETKPKQFSPTTKIAQSYLKDWISSNRKFSVLRLIKIGCTVLCVAAVAMLPVLLSRGVDLDSVTAELKQILSRLFPWNRGLVHSYWAPNLWALYAAAEKVLSKVLGAASSSSALTGGIVGSCEFFVLPNVPAWLTNVLMILCMMPCLVLIWIRPHPKLFLPALSYTYMCYFVLGFHVHEKAIIVVIALLALNAVESGCDAALFLRVCFVGTICLFPLLFEIRETCTAILILLTCCLSFYILLDLTITRSQSKRRVRPEGIPINFTDGLVVLMFLAIFIFERVGSTRMPFLPLMLYSVFGALCLLLLWYEIYLGFKKKWDLVSAVYTNE